MRAALQRPTAWLAGSAIASVAAVGAALVSQHMFGMEPCPWCILQRVIFLAIALVCIIGLVWRSRLGRTVAGWLMLVLAVDGMAAALWQHFKAAASSSCAMTVADQIVIAMKLDSLWPDVFLARASCADAAVSLMGIPYDIYSLTLFVLLALASWQVVRRA